MAFVRVDGDMDGVHIGLLEMFDDFGLLFGVEAEVGIDREDQEFMTSSIAAGEEVLG